MGWVSVQSDHMVGLDGTLGQGSVTLENCVQKGRRDEGGQGDVEVGSGWAQEVREKRSATNGSS